MWCVILQPKGTTRNALLPVDEPNLLSAAAVGTLLRRATAPEFIGQWKWGAFRLHLFAYKTGKAGTENKHELPPPHDTVLLFGEAVIIATKGTTPVMTAFSVTEYPKFYNEACGGFEELGDDDSDTDGEEPDAEEEEEEEEEVVSSEDDADDADANAGDVEEEEEVERPRAPVKAAKPKRNIKKAPAWFGLPELEPDSYITTDAPPAFELRSKTRGVIDVRCAFLNPVERCDFERGIYNSVLDDSKRRGVRRVWENHEFQAVYEVSARRAISNLDNSSYVGNTRLLTRLHDGEFKPHDISFMSYSDLYPEKWGNMIEMATKREAKMLEVDKSAATDMFRCSKCGKRQCTYYEMQTRSADEPMTQFIRCLNCGKQWRQ
jgi:DNA-directed RNA polymerase subunit M/transcription elongation factor TFIIS